MSKERKGATGIELAVRALRGEYELGIEHLSLIFEFAPMANELRMFVELDAGISDRDVVIALKAFIDRVEREGLPRFVDGKFNDTASVH